MNRRNFLKVVAAITGCAAIPQAFAETIPDVVPDAWRIGLGYVIDGRFYEQSSVEVSAFSGLNTQSIIFPEAKRFCAVTHVSINGELVKLDKQVVLDASITPMFPVGSLAMVEA